MKFRLKLCHGFLMIVLAVGLACTKAPLEGPSDEGSQQNEVHSEPAVEGQGLSPDDAGMKGKFQEADTEAPEEE